MKKGEYGRNVRKEHEHKRDERGEGETIKAGCRGWKEVKQKAEERMRKKSNWDKRKSLEERKQLRCV